MRRWGGHGPPKFARSREIRGGRRYSVGGMTDSDRRAEEAAQAIYDEQESNARTTGDGGPREEENASEFADQAEEESDEAAED